MDLLCVYIHDYYYSHLAMNSIPNGRESSDSTILSKSFSSIILSSSSHSTVFNNPLNASTAHLYAKYTYYYKRYA